MMRTAFRSRRLGASEVGALGSWLAGEIKEDRVGDDRQDADAKGFLERSVHAIPLRLL
jgi:hypothetical protein